MEGWFGSEQSETIDLRKKKRATRKQEPQIDYYEEELENENPVENPFNIAIPNLEEEFSLNAKQNQVLVEFYDGECG